jgi:hypothetical protein
VTFKPDNGDADIKVNVYDGTYDTDKIPTVTKGEIYVFSGWYTADEGGNLFDFTGTTIT